MPTKVGGLGQRRFVQGSIPKDQVGAKVSGASEWGKGGIGGRREGVAKTLGNEKRRGGGKHKIGKKKG